MIVAGMFSMKGSLLWRQLATSRAIVRGISAKAQVNEGHVPDAHQGQNEEILFSMNYEDVRPIRAAMEIKSGDRVMTIGSCGANAMALLLDDPAKVVAVDWALPQLHMAKLQQLGIKHLDHQEMIDFVGINRMAVDPEERVRIYDFLKTGLDPVARRFWDRKMDDIKFGIIHCGVFDKNYRFYGENIIPIIHRKCDIEKFIALGDDMEEQKEFYEEVWNTKAWRKAFKSMILQMMSGFDYSIVPRADYPGLYLKRWDDIVGLVPNKDNHFFEYWCTGVNSGKYNLRTFILKENFQILKERVDRMEWVHGELSHYLSKYPERNEPNFDGICLSNVTDWLSTDNHNKCVISAANICNPGSRIVFWNMRGMPKYWPNSIVGHNINIENEIAAKASLLDRSCFWEPFRVATVK